MTDAEASPTVDLQPLVWITVVSVTINVLGTSGWLLESVRDLVQSRTNDSARSAAVTRTSVSQSKSGSMYRALDLVLSQMLALYSLCLLLWLPLLEQSFLPPSERVVRYMVPAICVAIGRHLFFCCRGCRDGRSAVPSLTHAVSAVCHVLFLRTRTTLVLAALALTTEIGNIYTHLMGIVGERRAGRFPSWVAGLGVILAIVFNGLVYLVVLALALARRSPMAMPPFDVGFVFFYITYSFLMNTYSIYLVVASFFNSVLDGRVARVLRLSETAGAIPTQALANIRSALAAGRAPPTSPQSGDKLSSPADAKCSDDAVLITNMV